MQKKTVKKSKPQKAVAKKTAGTKSKAQKKPAAKSIRIPITNVYDGNDYTAQIFIGSRNISANVILDTGSSTLAVSAKTYNGLNDKNLKPTTLLQQVQYGSGGWAGPVIKTSVSLGVPENLVTINNSPVAIACIQQKGSFEGPDGILGLAYNALNKGYNLKAFFAKYKSPSPVTFPWPLKSHSFKKFLVQFNSLVQKEKLNETEIEPYFTEIEKEGFTANKFSFYTLRSWVHYQNIQKTGVRQDALNNGYFILGGGEEQKDLYTGSFVSLDVMHDIFYNVTLKAIQVDGCPPVPVKPVNHIHKSFYVTNSIIDSGTSFLALTTEVYNSILQSLHSLNTRYLPLINHSENGVPMPQLFLSKWPDIHFIFSNSKGKDTKLTCTPDTYWQVNFPDYGKAVFQISGEQEQNLFGLPLINNYYTIFDRSADKRGVIKFARIKK